MVIVLCTVCSCCFIDAAAEDGGERIVAIILCSVLFKF